jgi:Holliday junction resolvasome RuvABC DNA-binding subunit
MIGQLRGRLTDKRPNQVLVDVGGVGYLVLVPLSTFAALGELHAEVTLLIHTHVREDALALYGFLSSREKHFFEMLLSASGVGPSLASTSWFPQFAEAICCGSRKFPASDARPPSAWSSSSRTSSTP